MMYGNNLHDQAGCEMLPLVSNGLWHSSKLYFHYQQFFTFKAIMSKNHILKCKLWFTAFLHISVLVAITAESPSSISAVSKPNLLILMTDQQRFDAMSFHGGQAITPNMDRLAQQGVDVRQFFSAAPVCVPSRCSLFTGRYGHSHRVLENDARLAAYEPHLFKVLKQAGYRLGYIGKNHLLDTNEFTNFDFVGGHEFERPTGGRTEFRAFSRLRSQQLRDVASWASSAWYDLDEKYSDAYVDRTRAIEFINSASDQKPFCLCVSFIEPHVPHVAPRKFEKLYPLDKIKLPEMKPGILNNKAPRYLIKQSVQGSLKATDEDRRRYLAVYFSMVSWVDENVGAILEALSSKGITDNTIVVFTSDHGDFGFEYNMCKKDLVMPDALMHVPLLISWPGKLKPQIVKEALIEQVDVMPTLLDLCKIPIPFGCQGRSFSPILLGETSQHKTYIHGEICYPWMRNPYKDVASFEKAWKEGQAIVGHPLRFTAPYNVPGDFSKMLRSQHWKYIWYASGFEELYHLKTDALEELNLAGHKDYQDQLKEMRALLFQWLAETEDPLNPKKQKETYKIFSAWNPQDAL